MNQNRKSNLEEEQIAQIEKSLRKVSYIVKQKGREILNDFPITPPQFVALQWLNEYGDMTIGELSNKMFLAFSTMTDLVDRMEKNALVKRVRDDSDRRVVQIHLLANGKEIIEEVIQQRRDYLAVILKGFSQENVDLLEKDLNLLYEEVNRDLKTWKSI